MVKINNQSKQELFLDLKSVWKNCNPYFSINHSFGNSKNFLNKSDKILTENIKITKNFNSYFESIQSNICEGKVLNIVKAFSNNPSIIKIKQKFQCVSVATVRKVVKNLPSDKATAGTSPVKRKIVNFAFLS